MPASGARAWARRTIKGGIAFAFVLVVLAGGYVAFVAVRHTRPVTLPAPTGPYRIGRIITEWIDHARTDPLAPRPGQPRRLSVWLWYPAVPRPHAARAAYAPSAWSAVHFPGVVGWGETSFAAVRTHAVPRAPVAAGRFPVVVVQPGMGLSAVQFTTIAENLASHGYLVAGVTPTYSANTTVLDGHVVSSTRKGNPDSFTTAVADRLITTWAADARFVATRVAHVDGRLAGHVDPTRTAYVGHSFGGASSIQACAFDRHCVAAADLDGTPFGTVVHRGLRAPLMIMGSDNSCVTGTCQATTDVERRIRSSARSLLAASDGPVWCYTIDGTEHFNFTDYGAYYLAVPLRWLMPLGALDGDRALTITDAYLTAFLQGAGRGEAQPLLTHPGRYTEVGVQRSPH